MQRFGEKLRTLRTQRQMTTRDLALALGYTTHSNSYISLIENGKQKPSLNFVLRTAQFFNVSADLLTRDDLDLEIDGEGNSARKG
jgi:transcriptional regulator with XRE-family HTH domain